LASIRPCHLFRAIVSRIHDDGIVLDAEVPELAEQETDIIVMLKHAVGIKAETGLTFPLRRKMRPDIVRRLVAHHALIVGANVPVADVIASDDDDVWFLFCALAVPGAATMCVSARLSMMSMSFGFISLVC
jgi:hypothetical protein